MVIWAKLYYRDEAFQYDMTFKGYVYAAFPSLCRSSGYSYGEYASVCYVYRGAEENYSLIENLSDEMQQPVAEWSTSLLRDLEGPHGVILRPVPSDFQGRDPVAVCTFENTRRVASHLYATAGDC